MTAPAIDCRHLTHRYGGFTAVDDLTLQVAVGETLGRPRCRERSFGDLRHRRHPRHGNPSVIEVGLDFGRPWQRHAQLWAGLAATAPAPTDPHLGTARLVFTSVITPDHHARLIPGGHGACLIGDSRSLCAATGLRAAVWRKARRAHFLSPEA